ncbi:MAG: hypothetical protein ABSB79_15335 [Syntrophales bacterium]|jgi:hypothetical protein
MDFITKKVFNLINSMAVMMVIAYILTRSWFYTEILERTISQHNKIILTILFGGAIRLWNNKRIPYCRGNCNYP